MTTQFEMQFIGSAAVAAKLIGKYFGSGVTERDGQFSVLDSYNRDWYVSSAKNNLSVLITPDLDADDADDKAMLHDVMLLFRMSDAISVNDACAMRVNVDAPSDERKLALYYEQYVKYQHRQFQQFCVTVSGPWSEARPYQYEVNGLELDTLQDILLTIVANYATVTEDNMQFAENFALNFLSVLLTGKLQFRAFNSTFSDEYVFGSANWIHQFLDYCDTLWDSSWKAAHESLRVSAA